MRTHFRPSTSPLATLRIKYRHAAFRLPLLRNYSAICVGRTIWFKDPKAEIPPRLLCHELVHQQQMDRHGQLAFYAIYLKDYFKNLFRYASHQKAYLAIPFEVEARAAEENREILSLMATRLP